MCEKTLLKILAVFICVLCIVPTLEGSGRYERSSRLSGQRADVIRLEKKIHTLINKEREKMGLPVLSWDETLHSVARRHSEDMERRSYFSHDDPEGRNFCDRYKAARFACRIRVGNTTCLGAENILQDNLSIPSSYNGGKTFIDGNAEDKIAKSVVKRWMDSRNHRNNILTPYFKRQGIGIALSEDGKVYITENFC